MALCAVRRVYICCYSLIHLVSPGRFQEKATNAVWSLKTMGTGLTYKEEINMIQGSFNTEQVTTALLLAAGTGSRLYPLTQKAPEAMNATK